MLGHVKRFGAIIAVYLGIYLILPGCLCQILSTFGWIESSERQEMSQEVVASLASDTPCHCHDGVGKVAELVPAELVQDMVLVPLADLPALSGVPQVSPAIGLSQGRSPPPLPCLAANRLRFVTGVYLI